MTTVIGSIMETLINRNTMDIIMIKVFGLKIIQTQINQIIMISQNLRIPITIGYLKLKIKVLHNNQKLLQKVVVTKKVKELMILDMETMVHQLLASPMIKSKSHKTKTEK